MSKKVYRTAQGKTVDLGALQLQNETVRAVGNMGVNARGDKVNPQNATVDSRNNKVSQHYKKQTRTNVVDDVVYDSKQAVKKQKKSATKTQPQVESVVEEVTEVIEEEVVVAEPVAKEPVKVNKPKPVSGLAGAIAKAKSVKQEPMKTPRQISQSQSGVKKI